MMMTNKDHVHFQDQNRLIHIYVRKVHTVVHLSIIL